MFICNNMMNGTETGSWTNSGEMQKFRLQILSANTKQLSLTTPIVDMDAIVCHWTISNMHIAHCTIDCKLYRIWTRCALKTSQVFWGSVQNVCISVLQDKKETCKRSKVLVGYNLIVKDP